MNQKAAPAPWSGTRPIFVLPLKFSATRALFCIRRSVVPGVESLARVGERPRTAQRHVQRLVTDSCLIWVPPPAYA
eukprot:2594056-Prymnesium_polylepis.1